MMYKKQKILVLIIITVMLFVSGCHTETPQERVQREAQEAWNAYQDANDAYERSKKAYDDFNNAIGDYYNARGGN